MASSFTGLEFGKMKSRRQLIGDIAGDTAVVHSWKAVLQALGGTLEGLLSMEDLCLSSHTSKELFL